MEKKELIAKITADAVEGGVKESTVSRQNVRSFLPKNGKFTGYKVMNPNQPTAYLALSTTNGGLVSVSNLLGQGFRGAKEDCKFRQVTREDSVIKNGYVLTGTTPVNPWLAGSQAEVVAELLDKEFTKGSANELIVLPPKNETAKDGTSKIVPYLSEKEARENLTTRTMYSFELK